MSTSRTALATTALVLHALDTLSDAADAVLDLADRLGVRGDTLDAPRSVGVHLGERWDLGVSLNLRAWGLGPFVEHDPGHPISGGGATTAVLVVGPVGVHLERHLDDPAVPPHVDVIDHGDERIGLERGLGVDRDLRDPAGIAAAQRCDDAGVLDEHLAGEPRLGWAAGR